MQEDIENICKHFIVLLKRTLNKSNILIYVCMCTSVHIHTRAAIFKSISPGIQFPFFLLFSFLISIFLYFIRKIWHLKIIYSIFSLPLLSFFFFPLTFPLLQPLNTFLCSSTKNKSEISSKINKLPYHFYFMNL